MIKEGKFGVQEAVSLMVITISTRIFFSYASELIYNIGTSAWYMILVSMLIAVFGFTFLYLLLKRFPGNNIIEIYEITFGKMIGSIISLVTAAYFLFSTTLLVREFSEITKIYILNLTPTSFILLTFSAAMIVVCYMGIEVLARLAKFMIYILLAMWLILLILSYKNYAVHRLYPILGNGPEITLYGSITNTSFFIGIVILAVISTSLQGVKNIKIIGYSSIVISGLIISVSLLSYILAFPYFESKETTSVLYQLASKIHIGLNLKGLNAIYIIFLDMITFITAGNMFYASISIYCKIFRMQDIKPVIIPFAIMLYILSLIYNNIITVISITYDFLMIYGTAAVMVPYIISLIISAITGRKGGMTNA